MNPAILAYSCVAYLFGVWNYHRGNSPLQSCGADSADSFSGGATVDLADLRASPVFDRELGGEWSPHKVERGDLFMTTSSEPYELRWKAAAKDPSIVMHVILYIPCCNPILQPIKDKLAGKGH